MAESERNGETQNGSSLQMNTVSSSRDLLQRFISETHFPQKFPEAKRGEEEGILELSLGLSLNGRFGVDRKRPETLIRSSSISNFNLMDDDGNRGSRGSPVSGYSAAGAAAAIARTCSLPTEPAEEWRKRKEMQCMRRMDAKRRRLEKLKSVVRPPQPPPALAPRDPANSEEENGEENGGLRRQGSVIIDGIEGLPQTPQPLSQQGSIGSQGSGSSGISESESQPIQGTNKPNEARSPASVQSLPHKNEQKPLLNRGSTLPAKFSIAPVESTSMKVKSSENGAKETARNPISDMPFVSTRGDGPNGKRIEGFLYRYRNGDEVKIVCVCHGSFLSPAEFVKHAGGGDVTHPLRHIVVSPPLLLK